MNVHEELEALVRKIKEARKCTNGRTRAQRVLDILTDTKPRLKLTSRETYILMTAPWMGELADLLRTVAIELDENSAQIFSVDDTTWLAKRIFDD